MNDYKLKVILTILSAIVFSLIFILLAFVIPLTKQDETLYKKTERPKSSLEKISHGAQNR